MSDNPHADRLTALRAHLAERGLAGFVVPRADEFLGEEVPASSERLAWLTGFTGSAGMAVVLPEVAAVFSDGRYDLQLQDQTDPALWQRRHLIDDPPPAWLAAQAPRGAAIGYDPRLLTGELLERFAKAGVTMKPVEPDPIDALWTDRPAPPATPIVLHPSAFAGIASAEKREAAATALRASGHAACVLADPASVAWLLNLRGGDLPTTPFALAHALLHDDGRAELFADPARIAPALFETFGNAVVALPPESLPARLAALAGKTVRVDPAATPVWFAQRLAEAGATVAADSDPCRLPKACKNEAEQAGARAAHRRDAVALCRFLHWFEATAPAGGLTEIAAAERLRALRAEAAEFRAESFPAISGAGEHGAVIHYRATPESDRRIAPDEVYLIDSGGQYPDGTTDVTRTLWTGPGDAGTAERADYTLVLKGHVSLSTLVFPKGCAGPHLDAFARRALWDAGLDYDHGTGHGVGSYLSVHEGPMGLARAARPIPFAPGMILSNEPGLYRPGGYGIRIENLLLVHAVEREGPRSWLGFETLTLAPYDRRLIEVSLLSADEIAWIDAYHARVAGAIEPSLDADGAAWLRLACAPLG